MPRDLRGQEVEVGDRAVYVTAGRYTERGIVEVLDVRAKAKVAWLSPAGVCDPLKSFWVEPANLTLVTTFKGEELPTHLRIES